MVATPLGSELLAYLASFRNPAISLISSEWRPAFQSPLAIAYLLVAAVFAAWLLLRARGSRRLTPGLVVLAFIALAVASLRNIVFVGPVLALAIASLAPDGRARASWPLVSMAAAASAGAAATWALAVGPVRNEPTLDTRLVDYAIHHPPRRGHIAAYAGIGSYMLWRSPRAPVELDGWLEHFSAAELRGTYALLDGRTTNPMRYVRGLRIGAVIADRHVAIEALRTHGFATEFKNRAGTYLVRRQDAGPPSLAKQALGSRAAS